MMHNIKLFPSFSCWATTDDDGTARMTSNIEQAILLIQDEERDIVYGLFVFICLFV